jgi:hypothetical protein
LYIYENYFTIYGQEAVNDTQDSSLRGITDVLDRMAKPLSVFAIHGKIVYKIRTSAGQRLRVRENHNEPSATRHKRRGNWQSSIIPRPAREGMKPMRINDTLCGWQIFL